MQAISDQVQPWNFSLSFVLAGKVLVYNYKLDEKYVFGLVLGVCFPIILDSVYFLLI